MPVARIGAEVLAPKPEHSNFGESGGGFVYRSASRRMPTTKRSVAFHIFFQTTGEISAEVAPVDVDVR